MCRITRLRCIGEMTGNFDAMLYECPCGELVNTYLRLPRSELPIDCRWIANSR